MSQYEPILIRYLETVRNNSYIPHEPTDKQALFLLHDHVPEILYGGQAGGGKSDALLMAALQYIHIPDYHAILFRRTYRDLALPGALMDRAQEWLGITDAKWSDEKKTWTFPKGSTLTFGYLEGPRDKYRYQSSEFQFIGFDELTQFTEDQYLYLFSRLRRLTGSDIPLRMRAASNPGGVGHDWVKARFITSHEEGRIFIPATLDDNPYLDQEEYRKSLMKLDPITRAQLLNGDWDVRPEGTLFKRHWFNIVNDFPKTMPACRYWDKAATEDGGDYTVGALVGVWNGRVYILDIQRAQLSPQGVEALIRQTAHLDGQNIPIFMEQEPGSAGVDVIDHYARYVLPGFIFRGVKTTGSKVSRAGALASAAEAGNVHLLQKEWNSALLDEFASFPIGAHDDQVDAVSGAYNRLTIDRAERQEIFVYDEEYQISPI